MTTLSAVRNVYAVTAEYLDQVEAYLNGNREYPPDAKLLRRNEALPSGTILSAECGEDQYGPFIGVKIKCRGEDRNPRFFDPWDVPPIYLEEIAGLPIQWHRTVQKGKVYLRMMLTPAGHAASQGIPVARALANSPLNMATMFARKHHELRRAALMFASAHHRPHPPKYGREDAVRIASGAFERDGLADMLCVTADAFRTQLERAYRLADEMHARRYSEEAD